MELVLLLSFFAPLSWASASSNCRSIPCYFLGHLSSKNFVFLYCSGAYRTAEVSRIQLRDDLLIALLFIVVADYLCSRCDRSGVGGCLICGLRWGTRQHNEENFFFFGSFFNLFLNTCLTQWRSWRPQRGTGWRSCLGVEGCSTVLTHPLLLMLEGQRFGAWLC